MTWASDVLLESLAERHAERVEYLCDEENVAEKDRLERINRSLGQKFRHVRESEIAALRERQERRRNPLLDSVMTKLWARKLFLEALRPTILERFQ